MSRNDRHSVCLKCITLLYRYVVDVADKIKFEDAKEELKSLLSKPRLAKIPLLVLGNKSDLPDAASMEDVVKSLELTSFSDREVAYYYISCKDTVNIDITLKWLIAHSN